MALIKLGIASRKVTDAAEFVCNRRLFESLTLLGLGPGCLISKASRLGHKWAIGSGFVSVSGVKGIEGSWFIIKQLRRESLGPLSLIKIINCTGNVFKDGRL